MASESRCQREANRLVRYAWGVLLLAVTAGLAGGTISALTWSPGIQATPPEESGCAQPPCFDFDPSGMRLADVVVVIPMLGYVLTILLGLPGLLTGIRNLARGRAAAASQGLLTFVGPVVFFLGAEIVPHLLDPCYLALALAGTRLPEFYCEYSPASGAAVAARWHLLGHTFLGALPLATLYWLALCRWHAAFCRQGGATLPRAF